MSVLKEEMELDPVRVREVSESYLSSLTDLTINSKPLITMLTILAEENAEYASVIVDTIERHIAAVRPEHKLPILYLIDSIVKNTQSYKKHFNFKIVNIFCDAFSKVNERIREKMYHLRQTWNDVFPKTKLYTLDVKVNNIDPNWPVISYIESKSPAIHVNPNFFKQQNATSGNTLTDELKKKQMELIELERKKQELERTVSKKTQNLANQQQQQQQMVPKMPRAPIVGAPMPSVASLPKIPKVQQHSSVSRKDPRLNRGNNAARKVENGDAANNTDNTKKDHKPKSSDNNARKRSSDERHSSKRSKSSSSGVIKSSTSESSSSASTTSPNKRGDRKRHRSPQSTKVSHPKRSRDRTPDTLHEQNKREKKGSGASSSRGMRDNKKSNITSPKTLHQQTGDVDLRVPIKTNDVDLRQMPPVESIDITDDDDDMTSSKKSSNRIDTLFGNQDLDLRTLVKPPIIPAPKPIVNKNISKFTEVRAKLAADMSKQKDNLGRPLLYKQNNDPRKRPMETIVLDDLDISRGNMTDEDLNQSLTLIVNQAEEQLATNQINPEQYRTLVQQVFQISEKNKIQQAKRRESQRGARRSPMTIIDRRTPPQTTTFNDNAEISVDRLIAIDQVNAPPPAIPPTLIPGVPWQGPSAPPSTAGMPSTVQPVTTILDTSQDDLVRTIHIDGVPRDIRFYNETAVVFMNTDDPREIGFEDGQRRLTVDGLESAILHFNSAYKQIMIQGQLHRVRLGAPTRELYFDNLPYECYIGGPALPILIDGVVRMIGVDGPEPKVKIGEERKDLVLGKIHMIVDGSLMIPVFLDSKLQNFELPETGRHTLQIADYLQTILIDGTPIQNVEYGGLPKSFMIGNKTRFIRFTTLPKGVSKGKPLTLNKPPPPIPSTSITEMPVVSSNTTQVPAVTSTQDVSQPLSQSATVPTTTTTVAPGLNLNIEELFQRLITSGIIGNDKKSENTNDAPAEPKKEEIHKIDLNVPKTIKKRSAGIVDTLYNGMQCSSCGVRFPPEQTMKYSQHLDWHFRQNRRDRDASKKAHSRKWYYDVSDWIQFEEIEDLEEREKNWFEKHGPQTEFDVEEMEKSPKNQMVSCQAGPKGAEETCEVCHDTFEYFFNEESEEWHLKNAIRVEEKCYHPSCYEDFKTSLEREKLAEEKALDTSNPVETSVDENLEKSESMEQDDTEEKVEEKEEPETEKMEEDDDVIVLPPQNPTITEILDDDDDELGYKVNEIEDTTVDSPKIEKAEKEKSKSPVSVEEYTPVNMSEIKVKEEPVDDAIDNDDDAFEDVGTMEVSVLEEENTIDSPLVTTADDEASNLSARDITEASNDATNVSYDRNLSMTQTYAPTITTVNRIKVNITKPLGTKTPTDTPVASPGHAAQDEDYYEQMSEDEPEPEYEVKPELKDIQFKKLPPAEVGYETSGLCSIM